MIHRAPVLPRLRLSSLFAAALLVGSLGAQTPAPEQAQEPDPTESVLAQATPMTRETWELLCRASLGDSAPISAFRIVAKTKIREGDKRNEGMISYSYMAPHCLRFQLTKKNEMGRFGRRKSQYWMRENKEVIWLKTRDYQADREWIQGMAALARNYIALSDPKRLRLERLELMSKPPAEARQAAGRDYKKLTWISITSPDFALLESDAAPAAPQSYRVDLGLRPRGEEFEWTPAVAIVRTLPREGEGSGERETARSVLLRLYKYAEQDGFRIPFELAVHHRDTSRMGMPFKELPAQEIWIQQADLRAEFQVEDFHPEEK